MYIDATKKIDKYIDRDLLQMFFLNLLQNEQMEDGDQINGIAIIEDLPTTKGIMNIFIGYTVKRIHGMVASNVDKLIIYNTIPDIVLDLYNDFKKNKEKSELKTIKNTFKA